VGFLGPGPDRAGDPDRLLAVANGFLGPPGKVQRPGVTGEHPGALSRWWLAGQQPLGLLVGSQRAGLVASDPVVVAQAGPQHGGPNRLGGRIHQADRLLNQPDGALHRPGEDGRLGCPVEQVDPVQGRRPIGRRNPLPEFQGALVM
jgi:hypothetical protein